MLVRPKLTSGAKAHGFGAFDVTAEAVTYPKPNPKDKPNPEDQRSFQILSRENPLRIPIFSAGDGRACGARDGACAALGRRGARCDGAHGIPESSDGRGASRVSERVPAARFTTDVEWREGDSHLATAVSEPQAL